MLLLLLLDTKGLLLGVIKTLLADAWKHMFDAVSESLVLMRCICLVASDAPRRIYMTMASFYSQFLDRR